MRVTRPGPVRRGVRSTALGNQVDLLGPGRTSALPGLRSTPWNILNANLSELSSDPEGYLVPGTWVLSVTASVLATTGVGLFVIPLIAEIQLGAGGVVSTVEMDAFPGGTLQLPGIAARVLLKWDSLPTEAAVGLAFTYPDAVRVKATLQRANIGTTARRSFLLNRDGAAAVNTTGAIPPFAKRVMAYALPSHRIYGANGVLELQGPNAAFVRWSGPELDAMRAAGEEAVIPGQVTRWIAATPLAEDGVGQVSFKIEL